ncbi:MAG: iron(III) transport system substrate-binding protein [Petrotoga sp.]|nr:iron(III) transport system substrate-binding protein [Petrotoga sp.]
MKVRLRLVTLLMIISMTSFVFAGWPFSQQSDTNKEADQANQGSISQEAFSSAQQSSTPEISGKLNFYTSQPDEDAAKLVDAFERKYPKVEVNVFRSGTEEVVSKIRAEKLAGSIQADVLLVADAVTFESLKEEGLLLSYKSKELDAIPENMVDKDYTYTGTKVIATAIVVNTNKVKELPNSWFVLTDEKSKGQAMMPGPLYSGAAAYNVGVLARTPEFGWQYFEDLRKNEMVVGRGNGGVLQAVATGEKSYGMVVDFIVVRAEKEGSPVKLIYPKEGVPVITEPVGILKETKNEAAAQAFVDFILSEEGQKLQAEIGYIPVRRGVQPPIGLKGIDELKVLEADITELYQNREADKTKFIEIFH